MSDDAKTDIRAGKRIDFQTQAMVDSACGIIRRTDSTTITLTDDTVIPRTAVLRVYNDTIDNPEPQTDDHVGQPQAERPTEAWYARRVAKNGDFAFNGMIYYYDYHAGGRTVYVRPIVDDAGPRLRVYDKTRNICTDIADSKARPQSHRKKKTKTTQQKPASPPAQTTTEMSTEQLCELGEQLQQQIGDLITRIRAGQQAAETIWLLANAADIKRNHTQEDQ